MIHPSQYRGEIFSPLLSSFRVLVYYLPNGPPDYHDRQKSISIRGAPRIIQTHCLLSSAGTIQKLTFWIFMTLSDRFSSTNGFIISALRPEYLVGYGKEFSKKYRENRWFFLQHQRIIWTTSKAKFRLFWTQISLTVNGVYICDKTTVTRPIRTLISLDLLHSNQLHQEFCLQYASCDLL